MEAGRPRRRGLYKLRWTREPEKCVKGALTEELLKESGA